MDITLPERCLTVTGGYFKTFIWSCPSTRSRARQAIFTLASALIQAQVEFLPSQPNVFPQASLNDVAELMQAIIDRMPTFSQELGWD